jgi:hypothetical protein
MVVGIRRFAASVPDAVEAQAENGVPDVATQVPE